MPAPRGRGPLDDLAGGPKEVRLLGVLECPMRAHHALEDGTLEAERLLTVARVHQVDEVQVTVAQRGRIAPALILDPPPTHSSGKRGRRG